jgi:3'(2'), 5'-bisphosphate nucleotidase
MLPMNQARIRLKRAKTEISATYKGKIPTVIVSRSHRDERTQEFLDDLGEHKEITMGSSLKLCLVAEGKASLYPRLAPTYTWDTAAADAIVRAAGGSVKNLGGQPLNYPTKAQKNPFFVVRTKD